MQIDRSEDSDLTSLTLKVFCNLKTLALLEQHTQYLDNRDSQQNERIQMLEDKLN